MDKDKKIEICKACEGKGYRMFVNAIFPCECEECSGNRKKIGGSKK